MSKQHHNLELETADYQAVENNKKKFALVKKRHDFQVFDVIRLKEVVTGILTGREINDLEIKSVVKDHEGLKENYCIIGW